MSSMSPTLASVPATTPFAQVTPSIRPKWRQTP